MTDKNLDITVENMTVMVSGHIFVCISEIRHIEDLLCYETSIKTATGNTLS